MQRRLFILFMLLAFLPAATVLLVNWQMSQRNLAYLDSPGLEDAMESALGLARDTLEREKARARREARDLARRIGAGEADPPPASPGAAYRYPVPDGDGALAGRGEPDPYARFGDLLDSAAIQPVRVEAGDLSYLLVAAPVPVDGEQTRLALLSPLDPELTASLDAIALGGSRQRQMRLFYGDLLRGDTLLTLLVLGLVILLVALWLSRRLARQIAGPLKELAEGTEKVAAGDLEHRVGANALDEIGDLVTSFNRMTDQLQRGREELRSAERVAAWQGVARRLAHEIKNPLTPINLAMHRIEQKSEDAVVRDCVEAVLEETGNLKRLADEFSLFARLPTPVPERVDLKELVTAVAELYIGRRRIELEWEGWPDALPVDVDPGQMRQLFANLVKNAAEAMVDGGTLTLAHERGEAGGFAIAIRDQGPGLSEAPETLFEPSFTTKSSGTGLGLAIARKIAEDHGGRLTARDAPAGGAEFRLELPASPPSAMPREEEN